MKTYLETLAENSQIPRSASLGLRDLGTPVWKTLPYNKSLFFSIYFHDVSFLLSGSVVSDSLRPHGLERSRLLCLWDSPAKNTGEGCHSLLQGTLLTQGSSLGLLHCRQILYHLSHQGSPIFMISLNKWFWIDYLSVLISDHIIWNIITSNIPPNSNDQIAFFWERTLVGPPDLSGAPASSPCLCPGSLIFDSFFYPVQILSHSSPLSSF